MSVCFSFFKVIFAFIVFLCALCEFVFVFFEFGLYISDCFNYLLMKLLLFLNSLLLHILNQLLDVSDPLLLLLVENLIILHFHQPPLLKCLNLLLSVHSNLLQVHLVIHFLILTAQLKFSRPLLAHPLLLNLEFIVYAFLLLPEFCRRYQPMLFLLCLHVVFQFVPYVQSHLVHLVVGKVLELLDILQLLVSQLSLEVL